MTQENKTLDTIHIEIHALRLMPNYKPTVFEQKINRIISDTFKDTCEECKAKSEQFKYQPIQQKKGFLEGVFGG